MVNLAGSLRFTVDSNVNRLRNKLGRFMKGIPDMEDDVAREFSENVAEEISDEVRNKFDRFDGDLEDVDSNPSGSTGNGILYEVDASAYSSDGVNYAAWHEFANQPVENAPIKGDLKRWGAQRGYLSDWNKYGVQTIEVTPMNQQKGSFMQPAIQRAISEQRRKMRSGNNAVSRDMKGMFK